MSVRSDQIKLLANTLEVGEQSEPSKCPFCQADHEFKFSVKRTDEGLLYNCFRGKCGARGFVPDNGGFITVYDRGLTASKPSRRNVYDATKLRPPNNDDEEFFRKTWGIRDVRGNVFVTPDDRYAFRLRDITGFTTGWHIRQPVWKGIECHRLGTPDAKGMTYKDKEDGSKLAWFLSDKKDPSILVLVEDYISALKIWQAGYSVACIFGTKLGQKDYEDIRKAPHHTEVVVWLDKDAELEAYAMQRRHGVSLNMRIVTTKSDPKDISIETIREIL